MPCGKGTWPAIWMLGTNGPWPAIGEIDILEHMGHSPELASGAVHTSAGSAGQAAHGKAWVPTACTAFHDYQLLWTRDGLTLGVDGAPFWHYARPADPRVGYFANDFTEFEAERGVAQARRSVISRFRLEKANPQAAVSDPIKPITFSRRWETDSVSRMVWRSEILTARCEATVSASLAKSVIC